ncbi:hypothetical protein HHE02_14200 [Helicobacter heilmannii]|uniref:hypothetical protein n=1 Tax=Helicobacter heilmannii TaxID=35817 RepID=UPI0006A23A69|nr:hypothetical protein [Helicobacter heilmannii]CRF48110.1 hypothetical protein HHE02_14200 [Helicobacter heilmannii]
MGAISQLAHTAGTLLKPTDENLVIGASSASHLSSALEQMPDLSGYLKETPQTKEAPPPALDLNEQVPSSASTGIKDLDRRVKTGDLTMFDYYLAKNYLGIDLNAQVNGSVELRQKIANRTQATQNMYQTLKALDLGDGLINKFQENSGIYSGLRRKLNEMTGGIIGVNANTAEFMTAMGQYVYSLASAINGGGKITNQAVNDARNIIDAGFRGKEENTARMGEAQSIQLKLLMRQMGEVQALGGKIPKEALDALNKYRQKNDYIKKTNGKIDKHTYSKIGGQ